MLKKHGASGDEVEGLIGELQGKMQAVENLCKEDEHHQNELLSRVLDARRQKRKKIADKLQEVENKIRAHDVVKQEKMDAVVQKIQDELREELEQDEADGELQREALKQEIELKKRDKLSGFQDRLKNAKGDNNFQSILEEYQNAQKEVDRQMQKEYNKQDAKLEAELKARRARRRNQA